MESEDEFMSVKDDIENFDSDDEFMSVDGGIETFYENASEADGTASNEEEIGDFEEDFEDDSDGIASDGDGTCFDDDETGDSKEGFGGDVIEDDSDTVLKEERFTVLKEEDIRKQQEADITQASNVLLIPRVPATILLRHYNWNVEKAQDAWFADEEKVRKDVGLLDKQVKIPIRNTDNAIMCLVCLDELPRGDMCAAACGHLFCKLCWTQYISLKIADGAECLKLRCPDPSCTVAVGQDIVNKLVSDENKEKYSRYLYRSYVEYKKNIKWCPGPGCESAIEFVPGSTSYDVVCSCEHSFCWNCVEDNHRPVDCDTVHEWIMKNSAESENVAWILANSKSCPKCKRPIQKNEGCMHMRCPCGFHFCWLCLGAWSTHGKDTGGYYKCNIYGKAKAEGKEKEIRTQTKDYLDKYAFYYERFAENQRSRIKAVESLHTFRSKDIKKLSKKYGKDETELGFITEAWLQIIECRRVLQWTYAYGYYLPQNEHEKTQFFQFWQGEAESALEKLHQCGEVELKSYLAEYQPPCMIMGDDYLELLAKNQKENEDKLKQDFKSFPEKLGNLTRITLPYFEKLVCALENGLSEVNQRLMNYA